MRAQRFIGAVSACGAAFLAVSSARAQSTTPIADPVPPWLAPAAATPTGSTPASATPTGSTDAASSPDASTPAVAAPTEEDVIVTRAGREVRGVAVDVRVGQTVTIRNAAGALQVIPWADVSAARGPSFGPATGATARGPSLDSGREIDDGYTPRSSPRGFLQPHEGAVPVIVESDGDPLTVSLLHPVTISSSSWGLPWSGSPGIVGYGGVGWGGMGAGNSTYGNSLDPYGAPSQTVATLQLCNTPCTLYLRPGSHSVRVGGPGRRESDETLDVGSHGGRVRFHSASRNSFSAGQVFLWAGAGVSLIGVLLFVETTTNRRAGVPGDAGPAIGLMVGGGIAVSIGIPLVVMNFTGRVESSPLVRAMRGGVRLAGGASHDGAWASVGATF